MKFDWKKGYILNDPELSPITSSFWMGSYANEVGAFGKPWRKVCNEKNKVILLVKSFHLISVLRKI